MSTLDNLQPEVKPTDFTRLTQNFLFFLLLKLKTEDLTISYII